MNGTATDTVASSWIEALGGVSMCWILSTPPDFCAAAGSCEDERRQDGEQGGTHIFGVHCFLPRQGRA